MTKPTTGQPGGPAGARIGAIDGLRGLALVLVVVFHLFGAGRVSGGVDVFLVLSGFLLTGSLLRRVGTGQLNLADHYGRTLARLAPAALVVLAAIGVATFTLAPRGRWSDLMLEIGASATWWENWQLITTQNAYGAAGPGASPLQHFWSLAVQGQFFAVWPLVVLACAGLARLTWVRTVGGGGRRGPTTTLLLGAVAAAATLASFGYAQWLTVVDQPTAYFSTFARFWEPGVGALAAIVLPRLAPPGRWRAAGAWVGLAAIVACGLLVDGAALFPGPLTLVPVGGALLVLLGTVGARGTLPDDGARTAVGQTGPARLLGLPALRRLADISYALYLWHWPLLVFWLTAVGRDRVGPLGATAVLAASLVLGWATTRWVADPVLAWVRRPPAPAPRDGAPAQRRPRVRPAVAALCVLGAASLAVLGLGQAGERAHTAVLDREVALLATPSSAHPGAAVLAPGYDPASVSTAAPRPATYLAPRDRRRLGGCVQRQVPNPAVVECTVVPTHSGEDPTARVYLLGASHIQTWEDAFVSLATENGWELSELLKHGCRYALGDAAETEGATMSAACSEWNRDVRARLRDDPPDVVIVEGTRTYEDGSPEVVLPGQAAAWRELDAWGITVVTVRDNPRFARPVPECLDDVAGAGGADGAISPADRAACGRDRGAVMAKVSPLAAAPASGDDGGQGDAAVVVPKTAVHLDLTDRMCTDTRCEAVVGNVVAYRDDDHLTGTYVRSLLPALRGQLGDRAPWLVRGSADEGGRAFQADNH
ncbi:acyltransferase family protein [Promicromonospora sp. Populi]|uniref:acyltransferase family protein n=1 Tax=Promicromonospora sp. Populi TaxID=3239420 RepID=UPI0034E219A7